MTNIKSNIFIFDDENICHDLTKMNVHEIQELYSFSLSGSNKDITFNYLYANYGYDKDSDSWYDF